MTGRRSRLGNKAALLSMAALTALLAGCGSTVQGAGSSALTSDGSTTTGNGSLDGGLGGGTTSGPAGSTGGSGLGGSTDTTSGLGSTGGGSLGTTTTGSGTSSSRGSGSSTTVPGGTTAGGTKTGAAQTGPIELGFIVTNVSNAGSLGVNAGQTFSDQQLYDALVKATNARGGINGRKITPIYGVTDTASTDWSSQFQAACAKFTQDNHVTAVLGYIFIFLDSFETCLAKANVPHLYGGYTPGDTSAQQHYPTLVATTNPTGDAYVQVALSGATSSGLLTPKRKLGVVLDTCANDDKAFNRVGPAFLGAHHIKYETVTGDCSNGQGDTGKAASQVQNAVLKFRADGVDTVYVNGVAALLFAEDAESQHWHPTYILNTAGAALEGNVPNDQLANFHGFGWEPSVDVDPGHQPYKRTPAEKNCLKMLASQGLVPKGYNDFMEAFTTCDGLSLYTAALKADGGQTAASSVVPALSSVIGRTPLASTYNGQGRYVAYQHGGPAAWREWGWQHGCGCFKYTGTAHPLG